ncbi:MAG: hypothetical protein SVX43_23905 [Cyanobacteriota bacterium]|nr:hypothetical protein [Cyanobacteriota bacterium]
MPSQLPHIDISTKSVFVCKLWVAENVDVEKICNWLRKHQAREISFSEDCSSDGKLWIVNFCTENEQLVTQLQNRCREKVSEYLKQKEKRIDELTRQVKQLHQNFHSLQLQLEAKNRHLTFLTVERQRIGTENIKLKQLESDHNTLRKAYQTQHSKLAELENTLKQLQSQKAESSEALNSKQNLQVEVCRFCGKPAMPGQEICLNCAR